MTQLGSAIVLWMAFACSAGCHRREQLDFSPISMATVRSSEATAGQEAVLDTKHPSLSARVKFRSVSRWGLSIEAEAVPKANGEWPRLKVSIGGVPYAPILLDHRARKLHWVTFWTEPGYSDIEIALLPLDSSDQSVRAIVSHVELVPR